MTTNRELAEAGEIIRIVNGSRLYGTFQEDSDYDYMAIYVEPPEIVFSDRKIETSLLHDRDPEERNVDGGIDGIAYSLRHFIKLALDGNPSILTVLFSTEKFWPYHDEAGRMLLASSADFVSMKAAPRFKGYMKSQLERLQGIKTGHIPNRPWLVEKYGYDTKYAMSVARLCMQGIEYFSFGTIESPMDEDDIDFLMRMRNGEFTYDETIAHILRLETSMHETIAEALLPEEPNYAHIYYLSQEIHQLKWELING